MKKEDYLPSEYDLRVGGGIGEVRNRARGRARAREGLEGAIVIVVIPIVARVAAM